MPRNVSIRAAKQVASLTTAGILLVAVSQLVILVFERYLPDDASRFKSVQEPVGWLGILLAGVVFLIGKQFRGDELATSITRNAVYYLGACLALTFFALLASSLIHSTGFALVPVLAIFVIAALSIKNLLRVKEQQDSKK